MKVRIGYDNLHDDKIILASSKYLNIRLGTLALTFCTNLSTSLVDIRTPDDLVFAELQHLQKIFLVGRLERVTSYHHQRGHFGLNMACFLRVLKYKLAFFSDNPRSLVTSERTCALPAKLEAWMYMIPLGLIVVNAVTQAMNMPEEQAAGQAPQSTGQRAPSSAVRRR
ncbi:hypothetical protein GIB67_020996 [Kingdonia uniflora]|uniref:Uncharacterized protein n=1 Tax=Kingdonia uniflora TaxID=39325 RepID=A0A7J7N4R6_9MAGN|nr:hypothetical protein GIB67_020996 [Kingdonia uniflora]